MKINYIIYQMKYFKSFAAELNSNKIYYTHYFNNPEKQIRQSSVAMIFKINSQKKNWEQFRTKIQSYYAKQNKLTFQSVCPLQLLDEILSGVQDNCIELLLTQRSCYDGDVNSGEKLIKLGNIVFPGGKCDFQEDDLTACVREVKQEIGLRLLNKDRDQFATNYLNLYLGKLNTNFFYRKLKNQKLFISCHIFLILSPSVTLILNTAQLVDSRWVRLTDLINPQSLFLVQDSNSNFVSNVVPKSLNFFKNSIIKNLQYVQYSALNVNMDKHLWGLTFHLWLHTCRVISQRLKSQQQNLNEYISKGERFSIKFKWYYLPGYVMKYLGENWNYRNRIQAFAYPLKKKNVYRFIPHFILLILLCCTIHYIYS